MENSDVVTGQRDDGFKLKEDIWTALDEMKFFTVRTVRHWDRLPRAAVFAPIPEVFKARVDGVLSSLVQQKVTLPMAGVQTGLPTQIIL